jgi:tetratricopeptide (TPR) repeat protein
LAILLELGDRHGQAHVLDSLGYIHHQLGDHQQSVTHYQRALKIFQENRDREYEASTLVNLGDTHQALGDLDTAEYVWQQALAIFTELDHPETDQVRAKLRDQQR